MHKWSSNLVGRGANFSHANLNGNYETEKCHKMLAKKSKDISIKEKEPVHLFLVKVMEKHVTCIFGTKLREKISTYFAIF